MNARPLANVTLKTVANFRSPQCRFPISFQSRVMIAPLKRTTAVKCFLHGWQTLGIAILGPAFLLFTLGCGPTKPAGSIERGRVHLVRQDVIETPDGLYIYPVGLLC